MAAFFFDCAEFHDSGEAGGAQDRGNGVIRHWHWFTQVRAYGLSPHSMEGLSPHWALSGLIGVGYSWK